MFNKRSFLLGLGVGIIIGALLLELFNLGKDSQSKLNDLSHKIEEPTESISTEGAEIPPTPTILPVKKEQETVATSTISPTILEKEATKAPAPTPSDDLTEKHLIQIKPGFKITTTANLLKSAGIIDDANQFIREMKASKKAIRAGYFLCAKGITAKEAVEIVSSTPLTKKEVEQIKKAG